MDDWGHLPVTQGIFWEKVTDLVSEPWAAWEDEVASAIIWLYT